MKITHCKVNHMENPCGYQMGEPVFSYVAEEAKGKRQTEASKQMIRPCSASEDTLRQFDDIMCQLRDGTDYCFKDSAAFMEPLIAEYRTNYPDISLYARGDSGFATPELYDLFEGNNVKYAICLKMNSTLFKLAQDKDEPLSKATRFNRKTTLSHMGNSFTRHPHGVCAEVKCLYSGTLASDT